MAVPFVFPSILAKGGAQPPFDILVANLAGPSDPSRGTAGNPVRLRNGFRQQQTTGIGGAPKGTVVGTRTGSLLGGAFTRSGGTVTIADDDFTVPAEVLIGPFVLVTDEDFDADGLGVNTVATNLAAAISALPGYDATPAAAVVTVEGPLGDRIDPISQRWQFRTFGDVSNFTPITPDGGFLTGGLPEPRAMTIL
jgi:hypothetical protein